MLISRIATTRAELAEEREHERRTRKLGNGCYRMKAAGPDDDTDDVVESEDQDENGEPVPLDQLFR